MKRTFLSALAIVFSYFACAREPAIPRLENINGSIQLIVNNKPFLVLGGELHNSSAGSAHYMRPIWARLSKQNINTVFVPVSWELVEPEEGKYDFSLVDSMLQGARKENLKLVVLWFGSWKNGRSTYSPGWIKTDPLRFPLAKNANDKSLDVLSTFGKNAVEADARAFGELMKYIKKVDSKENTILMVQVENEVGILGSTRDFSETANKSFNGQVPKELMDYLEKNKSTLYPALEQAWAANGYQKKGKWEEVFGNGSQYTGEEWKTNFSFYTEEIFMAWHYATYIGKIAKKGKDQYALPMYVNAWLRQPGARNPGQFPSGGPLPEVIDIWRAAAPSIDFIAPDIYAVDEFDWICEEYKRSGNPLLIPETTVGVAGSARSFYAFGKYGALGYAPFGIDGGGIFNSADPKDESLGKVYNCLQNIESIITRFTGTENITGIYIPEGGQASKTVEMGDYRIIATRFSAAGLFKMTGGRFGIEGEEDKSPVGLIVVKLQDNEFLIAGGIGGVSVNIARGKTNKWENIGLESVDEISYENGKRLIHRLNGDETAIGAAIIKPGEVKIFIIKMYGF